MLSSISLNDIRAIYLSLPIAACLIDRSHNFIAANDRYAALMKHPLQSIVGRNMVGLNPVDHIENVTRDFRIFDSGQLVTDHEIELDGKTLLVSVSPFRFDGSADVSSISVTLQDITNRKFLERELARTVCDLKEAQSRITELANTDFLTGLPNRRSFEQVLIRSIALSQREKTPLSLLMIDVDAFKSYNDLYGHMQGDTCLANVAKTIGRMLRRPGDVAARYGGEEFAVILHNTDLNGAFLVAERMRASVQSLGIQHEGVPWGNVTLSVGVFSWPDLSGENDLEAARRLLIDRADQAVYRAKSEGRNRVANVDV